MAVTKTRAMVAAAFLALGATLFLAAEEEDGESRPVVTGPWLQGLEADSIIVMWETAEEFAGSVGYGRTMDLGRTAKEDQARKIHEVRLTGLTPDTKYSARVVVGGGKEGPLLAFKTGIAKPRPYTFVVYGDSRISKLGAHLHERLAKGVARWDADAEFVLHMGDYVFDGRNYEEWKAQYFDPARDLLRRVSVFPIIGNHEHGADWYYKYFAVNAERENTYAFTYGDARFICFDSNQPFAAGSPQYEFIEKELRGASQRWKFLACHAPALSSGFLMSEDLLREIAPLAEKHGVDVFWAGHDHHYERSLKDNVMHIVSGGGGAELNPLPLNRNKKNFWSQYFRGVLHYCRVTVEENKVTVEARAPSGVCFDRWE
ncbi:MAG: metallophosphoesterase family protein, partial [Planctomycetes bacterium]|nr:metallophosphoesterase family protein [Planctomycetota bacterium]